MAIENTKGSIESKRAFAYLESKSNSLKGEEYKPDLSFKSYDNYCSSQNSQHKFKPLALAGSIAGVLLPMALIFAKSKGNFIKNLSEIKNIIAIFTGALAGGVTGGIIGDKGNNALDKIKEGSYQLIANVLVPFGAMHFLSKNDNLLQKLIKYDFLRQKIAVPFAGIMLGVTTGAVLSNFVNKVVDKNNCEKRKFHPQDMLLYSDDIVTAFAVSAKSIGSKLGKAASGAIPFLAVWQGYESGSK